MANHTKNRMGLRLSSKEACRVGNCDYPLEEVSDRQQRNDADRDDYGRVLQRVNLMLKQILAGEKYAMKKPDVHAVSA
jgi:hypothetical protein